MPHRGSIWLVKEYTTALTGDRIATAILINAEPDPFCNSFGLGGGVDRLSFNINALPKRTITLRLNFTFGNNPRRDLHLAASEP